MNLDLDGRRALVVGGSRGMGLAIARMLCEEGAVVSLCARNAEQVGSAAVEVSAAGRPAAGRALDVNDFDAVRAWVYDAACAMGGLDIVIWNVSAQQRDWDACLQTDVRACVNLMDAAIPLLKESAVGSIVGISSQAALLAVPTYPSYSAAKACLLNYFGSLARLLAPAGVRVNSVSPSEVDDEHGVWGRIRRERPERYARALEKNVRGRLATIDEVARVVVFVASPAASLLSGANVLADGMSRDFTQF